MNRPPDSSSRSHAVIAVIVGDLGNARAIAVPTLILSVCCAATDAAMNAVFVVSAAQHDSNPASSTILAIGPIIDIGPPTPIPYSISLLERLGGTIKVEPKGAACALPNGVRRAGAGA